MVKKSSKVIYLDVFNLINEAIELNRKEDVMRKDRVYAKKFNALLNLYSPDGDNVFKFPINKQMEVSKEMLVKYLDFKEYHDSIVANLKRE